MTTMNAALCSHYGDASALTVVETEIPKRQAGELLIQVHASSINPVDWKILRGDLRVVFGLKPPKILGGDFAGTVLEADPNDPFNVGDKVWGLTEIRKLKSTPGAHAQITRCASHLVDHMPKNLSYNEAATLPLVGLTAYQSLVHHAQLKAGQRVLINGCSGGVGTIAIQLAKALGATVTGVCSDANQSLAYDLGCDQVIDYTTNNLLEHAEQFDVWFDVVGHQRLGAIRHQLRPNGTYINIVKLLSTSISALFNPLRKQSSHAVFVAPHAAELAILRQHIEAGAIKPIIDTIYTLDDIARAFSHSRTHRVVGKLGITMDHSVQD